MSQQADWISLVKTINNYKGNITETWGHITLDNVMKIYKKQFKGKNLLDFLLSKGHYYEANTVASHISLINDVDIQSICQKHHNLYINIVKILSTDKMIVLYEQYHQKVSLELSSEEIFDLDYRQVMAKQYEKMIDQTPSNHIVLELINEFRLLTHPIMEDFFHFLSIMDNIEVVKKVMNCYHEYTDFIPLVYRFINEYYLEFIKDQTQIILDMNSSSPIIVSEYFDNIKKCVISLPKNYVDFRYIDRYGNNILFYLVSVPNIIIQSNEEIFQTFFDLNTNIPWNHVNHEGNTIFHLCALYENEIFMTKALEWFHQRDSNDLLKNCLNITNNKGKDVFDILLDNQNYLIMIGLIDYLPTKISNQINNIIINNFSLVDKISNRRDASKIYVNIIDYFLNILFKNKNDLLFNIKNYNDHKNKIIKILNKYSYEDHVISSDLIDKKHLLNWLLICIKIYDFDIFTIILEKYFDQNNNDDIIFLSETLTSENQTLLHTAICYQRIPFINALINHKIDLFNHNIKNTIVGALKTKNPFLIRLIRKHVLESQNHNEMVEIMTQFIDIIETHESYDYNSFSIKMVISKLWKTIENYLNHLLFN